MARPLLISTRAWSDLPLEELARRAGEWGYQGLELAAVGDHLEIQRALSESSYCTSKLELLARNELTLYALSNSYVGQAIAGMLSVSLQSLLPDYVRGDGEPEGVRERAVEEMLATVRVAQELGAGVIVTATGYPFPSAPFGDPGLSEAEHSTGLANLVHHWRPVLEACQEAEIRLAFELRPGHAAHDLPSARSVLETLEDWPEVGFVLNPAMLFWQGIDPVEALLAFPNRIHHVHIQDVTIHLNGRTSLLCEHLPPGDERRGWDLRSPGHGGIDWEAFIRTLNRIDYRGAFSMDWADPDMDRDYGAEDACRFIKRLDFEPAPRSQETNPFFD